MGRKVILHDYNLKIKTYGDSNETYKAPNGKYYSCQKIYEEGVANEDFRKKCITFFMETLNLQIAPPFLLKKLKEFPSYENLYTTIEYSRKNIEWVINNKDFENSTNAIMYITAILKNKYDEAIKTQKRNDLIIEKNQTAKNYEIAEGYMDIVGNKNRKGNDVSSLLGDL